MHSRTRARLLPLRTLAPRLPCRLYYAWFRTDHSGSGHLWGGGGHYPGSRELFAISEDQDGGNGSRGKPGGMGSNGGGVRGPRYMHSPGTLAAERQALNPIPHSHARPNPKSLPTVTATELQLS